MKNTKDKTGLLIKIIIPLLIIAVVGAIFVFKNANQEPQKQLTPPTQNESSSNIDNNDFALTATEIDLEKLKSYGLPIIIDFGADSCIPCKEMAPVLVKLNAEMQGKVIIKFVDVWKNQTAADGFPVQVIPTQFFFDKDGNPYVPSDPEKMRMNLYSTKDTNEHVYTAHQGGMTEKQIREVLKEMGVQ